MTQKHNDPIDILGSIYEKMYESAANGLEKAEHKSAPLLHQLIEESKEKLSEVEEVTREDLDKVGQYLERDMNDAAQYLSETGAELKDWLGFETALLESEFLYQMLKTADPTTLELLKLKEQAEQAAYHTGEITGPGTLVCDKCGEKIHFYRPGKIPPCPKCHGTSFHRLRD